MRGTILAIVALSAGVLPVLAAKAPVASALLSSNEAVALVGGPLEQGSKVELKPTSENGYDHNTSCGYFPKGYQLAEADRPPDRGLLVSLHTFRSRSEARMFYDLTRDGEQEIAKTMPGAKVAASKGIGEASLLSTKQIAPGPKAVFHIAMVTFLKGSSMAQVTAWKKGVPADAAATAAAKRAAARLP